MSHLIHAFHQLVRRPGLSAIVILMLALGIGTTTAIFALFYQVLMQPLPVPEPGRLVNVVRAGPEPMYMRESVSYPMFRDLEAGQSGFSGIAAHTLFTASVVHGDGALNVSGVFVSGSYFATLNLQPVLGRLIGPQDDPRIDESPVVVLSHELWQSRFGGDSSIVGRSLTVNGESLTVIGIAPSAFTGTQLGVRSHIYVPITMRRRLEPGTPPQITENRDFRWVRLIARLPDGVTLDWATAHINTLYSRILLDIEAPLRAEPVEERQQFLQGRLELAPGARGQGTIPGAAQSLTLLLGVTLSVLLIICVNIANLLLVRGAARAGEMAIRESMGASRGRLLRELLSETAVPAAIGGVLSIPVAAAILDAITPILPARVADALAVELGPRALAFAVLATLSTALLCGLFPALRTTRTNPALAMKGHALQALGGYGVARIRGALVTVQVAFSMVLLVLAGLFTQSLLNVARIDLGMDVDSLASFSVSPRLSGMSPERAAAVYDRIEQELAAQPGVMGVTSAAVSLLAGRDFRGMLYIEGLENQGEPITTRMNLVGPAFFATLSIPVVAGREFTTADTSGTPRAAVVNESFVRAYGLEGAALGKRLKLGPFAADGLEIVGVVADAVYANVKGEIPPQFFVPRGVLGGGMFSMFAGSSTFYVRTSMDPGALLQTIPRVVASVDGSLPATEVTTMRRQAQENVFIDRLVTILSASFAAVATLLAAVGLYGVLAYNVAHRTRELGLRLALGAEPANLRAMVFRQMGVKAVIGIVIGLVAAIALGRTAEALLYGLSSRDPFVLISAAGVLSLVVLAASWLPSRRASSIAPMEALRYE